MDRQDDCRLRVGGGEHPVDHDRVAGADLIPQVDALRGPVAEAAGLLLREEPGETAVVRQLGAARRPKGLRR